MNQALEEERSLGRSGMDRLDRALLATSAESEGVDVERPRSADTQPSRFAAVGQRMLNLGQFGRWHRLVTVSIDHVEQRVVLIFGDSGE